MADLRTDFVDDVLDTTQNLSRVYNIKNRDGSIVESDVIIEDVSVYTQQGSTFGASAMNETNQTVNEINNNLTQLINNMTERKLLWENPNPTASTFASQTINLSTNDYDELEIFYIETGSATYVHCDKILKGYSTALTVPNLTSSYSEIRGRNFVYVSDNEYLVEDNYIQKANSQKYSASNGYNIPIKIVGIKYH